MKEFDYGVAEGMYNALISMGEENRDIAHMQREAYPMEYQDAQQRIMRLNVAICRDVKQLVADVLFDKHRQTLQNPFYRQVFTNTMNPFRLEIASHEADRNLSLMFFHCVPAVQPAYDYTLLDLYTGGRYEVGANYSVNHLPHWLVFDYNIFNERKPLAERMRLEKDLMEFRARVAEVLQSYADKCSGYTMLQEITKRFQIKK